MLALNQNYRSLGVIHMVGIGGIGMSGIAEVMHATGYSVQGSDVLENQNTQRLSDLGIKVFLGHNPNHILGVSYVVISSAILHDNPEVKQALSSGIPVIRRAEMLAELMRFKRSIAVSGSHGKTTTTSLIASLFEYAGKNPTVINGGIINTKYTNAYAGSGEYLIAEADESDSTFTCIPAMIGVITNIDHEHLDFYNGFDNLIKAFRQFITNLPFYGFAVACIDHTIVRNLVHDIGERKVITYGIESVDAHVRAFNIRKEPFASKFDIKIKFPNETGSTMIEDIYLPIPGEHNILNALAAICIGIELNFGIKVIKEGFLGFRGVKRRFTIVGEYENVTIVDDYAHHPSEVSVTLATARHVANTKNSKVIAVFQPHRYSRLKNLLQDFGKCFHNADYVFITEVYSAGEDPIFGISGLHLSNLVSKELGDNRVKFVPNYSDIKAVVKNYAKSGDLVIMMGAGNISSWAKNLVQDLQNF